MRSKATINRLKMYKSGGKAIRAVNGKVVQPMPFQSWTPSGTVARVEPNRKWFGNTRVVGQKDLEKFRDAMSTIKNDPYQFVMRQSKLPMSLLRDPVESKQTHLLASEPFGTTFGKKLMRKRPKLGGGDLAEMVADAAAKQEGYNPEKDRDLREVDGVGRHEGKHPIFNLLIDRI